MSWSIDSGIPLLSRRVKESATDCLLVVDCFNFLFDSLFSPLQPVSCLNGNQSAHRSVAVRSVSSGPARKGAAIAAICGNSSLTPMKNPCSLSHSSELGIFC